MSTYLAQESAIIEAPAERIYGVIADYHEGHPAILPSRYFTDLKVVEGGQGEGTLIRAQMNVFGSKALYNLRVTKAVPGRLLVEEDEAAGVVTTFRLEPLDDGRTRVTITTGARTSTGLRGMVERVLNPAVTRRIYREELELLAQAAIGD
ncbi:MAG TPA: SRPBCC family protein [Anaerolineae bacterium]|nr:SRPBCC family protein [Anaerolineae bacterium]